MNKSLGVLGLPTIVCLPQKMNFCAAEAVSGASVTRQTPISLLGSHFLRKTCKSWPSPNKTTHGPVLECFKIISLLFQCNYIPSPALSRRNFGSALTSRYYLLYVIVQLRLPWQRDTVLNLETNLFSVTLLFTVKETSCLLLNKTQKEGEIKRG